MRLLDPVKTLALATVFFLLTLPFLHIRPQDTDSRASLRVVASTSAPSTMQLYYDLGEGLREELSSKVELKGGDDFFEYRLPLPEKRIKALRLDPLNRPGSVRIKTIEVLDFRGKSAGIFDLRNIQPLYQVAEVRQLEGLVEIDTVPGAQDPSVGLKLRRPLELGRSIGAQLGLFALVFGLCLAAAGFLRSVRGQTCRSALAKWIDAYPLIFGGAITLLLWVCFFEWPIPAGIELDPSWQAALVDAHAKGRFFGRDLVFTYGPFGYLFSYCWPENALHTKLVWEYAGRLALMACFVAAAWKLPIGRRFALFAGTLLVAHRFVDTPQIVLICLISVNWLLADKKSVWQLALGLVVLSFLSQAKFTYFLLCFTALVCASGLGCLRRNWRQAAGVPLGFAGLWLCWWLLAGQNPFHIAAFIRRCVEISNGYTWAMGMEVEWGALFWGLLSLLSLGWALVWFGTRDSRKFEHWATALFCGAALYLTWKHGFTRADGHVVGFFTFAVLLGCVLPAWFQPRRGLVWSDLSILLALAGAFTVDADFFANPLGATWDRVSLRSHQMLNPGSSIAWFHSVHETMREQASLPRISALVGRGTVDMISYEQGMIRLNSLNYAPRPVLQGYSAYTPVLMRINQRFILSKKAPDFLLVRHSTIDDRYAAQDDALLLSELPRRYEYVTSEKDYALLRRRGPASVELPQEREMVFNTPFIFGKTLKIPDETGTALWVQIFVEPTVLGSLRSFLYKPADLWLVLVDGKGKETRYRLLAKPAAEGFLINPLLQTQGDFEALMKGNSLDAVRALRIEAGSMGRDFWCSPGICVSRFPSLPLRSSTGHK
jgi:hypothetical protein